ncbi:MAG: hypothetical protein EZS28_015261, partial [Streblomastix strix]
MEKVI